MRYTQPSREEIKKMVQTIEEPRGFYVAELNKRVQPNKTPEAKWGPMVTQLLGQITGAAINAAVVTAVVVLVLRMMGVL